MGMVFFSLGEPKTLRFDFPGSLSPITPARGTRATMTLLSVCLSSVPAPAPGEDSAGGDDGACPPPPPPPGCSFQGRTVQAVMMEPVPPGVLFRGG